MKIYIVGNLLVKKDNLAHALMPYLQAAFPRVVCEEADPSENFMPEDGSVILDVVEGIEKVRWFEDLDVFVETRSVSPHDYDLGFHLKFLKKLHKISGVKILGLPQKEITDAITKDVIEALKSAAG